MNERLKTYLDDTERQVTATAGKARALSVRMELEAHLYDAIAEGQEHGLNLSEAIDQALQNLGELDSSALAGLAPPTDVRRRQRFAAWFTGITLLAWPWVGWLWINPIYKWAIPLSLLATALVFLVLGLTGLRHIWRPVLGVGILVTVLNGLVMPVTFVQMSPGKGPMLRERSVVEKENAVRTRMRAGEKAAYENLEAQHKYYSSPDATEEGARALTGWKTKPFQYPKEVPPGQPSWAFEIGRTDDFTLARERWSADGSRLLRSYPIRNVWIDQHGDALNQPYWVTVRSTMETTGLFLTGYLIIATAFGVTGWISATVAARINRFRRKIVT